MIPGWRSSIFHLSRDREWLKRAALIIVAGGFALALVILGVTPARHDAETPDPLEQALRAEWQELRRAPEPRPRALAGWLRRVTGQMRHLSEVLETAPATWESYQKKGWLLDYDTRPLLEKHTPEPGQRRLLEDFLSARLASDDSGRATAGARLAEAAELGQPLAGELHAALLMRDQDEAGAMRALMREGRLFADAFEAREDALRLALRLKDADALRAMKAVPDWLETSPPALQHQAGTLLRDPWLQWRGLLLHRLEHVPYGALGMAFFACLIWYAVFVLHGGSGSRRWLWPVPPVVAGVLSVWPVLTVASWQETANGMSADAPFPHDLWYYVAGVGLREELAKLAAAALFMPWLLWSRVPGRALLTGAFAGLGFALEENINYYTEFGGGVALVRLLTANFLHAALTGILTHALYTALRSRFTRVDGFLAALPAVVAVHGLYDYTASSSIGGMDFAAMVILAFVAWHFLDVMEQEAAPARRWVSPGSVVVIGAALLIAIIFISTALENTGRAGLAAAAIECVAVLPLMFIYWRRLGG